MSSTGTEAAPKKTPVFPVADVRRERFGLSDAIFCGLRVLTHL
ncbi:MAG: hypothetical protein US92_C0015G0001, partial [Candidatus Peregrinibacteria bacterium GW2011_GWA2_38_36]